MTRIVPLSRLGAWAAGEPKRRDGFDADAALEALATQLAATAVARDRAGGHAAHERALIRASGLLALSVPTAHGGAGGDWPAIYRSIRRLAQVDSALAHVYGFHHLQMVTVLLYGTPAQQAHFFRETSQQSLFWGNALNPADKRAVAIEVEGGYRIHGPKSFCSGSVGSDRLNVSAWHADSGSLLIAALPTQRPGITVQADWDAFGQKQTDSGTVELDHVFVARDEVLVGPGSPASVRATLRAQFAQLVLVNLYLGLAQGAFDSARQYTREQSRPWAASGVSRAADDPYVQHRYGELSLLIRPTELMADDAAAVLDHALREGEALTAAQRGEVAIAVAQAKALAHRAALEVTSQVFELMGARATSMRMGFDRFWRNARVHTLHDPVDYKLRDIGRHALEGRVPEPTPYS